MKSNPDPDKDYSMVRVKLDALNPDQVRLFLAIEETEERARDNIKVECQGKYFPSVPFEDWKPSYDETNLPKFGSIGHMYLCLWPYLDIAYSDNTTLMQAVVPRTLGPDLFNQASPLRKPEYPGVPAAVWGPDPEQVKWQIREMIAAITDQGEGGSVVPAILRARGMVMAVDKDYRPDKAALEMDYVSYDDTGTKVGSSDAVARGDKPNVAMDHFEVFLAVQGLLKDHRVVTWDQWHQVGNEWTPAALKTKSYDEKRYALPRAEDIAAAMNRLKAHDEQGRNYRQFCQVCTGAVAGVTKVLNQFWANTEVAFPYPSMAGAGDRMSICWAVFGKVPDLSVGTKKRRGWVLNHACQGLALEPEAGEDPAGCAAVEIYHTCRGSNDCKAEGGCGFVQDVGGHAGACSSKTSFALSGSNTCGWGGLGEAPDLYSAPSDNACGGRGGCAVPISASQLFPEPSEGKSTTMALYDFVGPGNETTEIGRFSYEPGKPVFDVAWEAYQAVLAHRGMVPPAKPAPSDLRLAFPPST